MTRTPLSTSLDGYEIWFVTGSQNLYGEETLRQVAEQSQAVADGLDGLPVKVVWKPVLKDCRQHPSPRPRGERPRRRHRRDRVDAHVQPREDVDRRASTRCRSRCCTCTRRRTSSCRGPTSTSTS